MSTTASIIGTNPVSLKQIEQELATCEFEFEALGGRDIGLAETIDRLRAFLASVEQFRYGRGFPTEVDWDAIMAAPDDELDT